MPVSPRSIPSAKLHPKTAAFPDLGLNTHAASHLFRDLSDNRQSDAGPFVIRVEPLKHAEQPVTDPIRYANAVVLHPDADGLIFNRLRVNSDVWASAGCNELHRVTQ